MEAIQIVIGIFVIYGGYLGISNVQQTKQNAVMQKSIDGLTARFDRVENKLDLFLKTEVDTLKEIIEKIAK